MRRLMTLLLSVMLVFALAVPASAAERFEAKVLIDGIELEFDVNPFVEDGRTLVPVRHLSEALGFEVAWDGAEQRVTLTKGETEIVLWIGSNKVLVNGVEGTIDVPAKIVDSRTFVPIRFIAENLNTYVGWDQEQQAAVVLSPKGLLEQAIAAQEKYPNQEISALMLMRMYMQNPMFPFPLEFMTIEADMAIQTYEGDTLTVIHPVMSAFGETMDMGQMVSATVGGKEYMINPMTGEWELNAEAEIAADPFASLGLEGFDPVALDAEIMAKAIVIIGETIEVDGRKLVEVHMDLSQFDMDAFFGAIFGQLGAVLGEEMPEFKLATNLFAASYLVDPATLFIHGISLDFSFDMTMSDATESMTMSIEMMLDMLAEPTDTPIEWPAGLKALLEQN